MCNIYTVVARSFWTPGAVAKHCITRRTSCQHVLTYCVCCTPAGRFSRKSSLAAQPQNNDQLFSLGLFDHNLNDSLLVQYCNTAIQLFNYNNWNSVKGVRKLVADDCILIHCFRGSYHKTVLPFVVLHFQPLGGLMIHCVLTADLQVLAELSQSVSSTSSSQPSSSSSSSSQPTP